MQKLWLGFLGLFLIFLNGCQADSENSAAERLPKLPTTQVVSRSVTTYEDYPCQLRGRISSEIRAKVSGYIRTVEVEEGEAIQKGDLLFTLETQALEGEVEAARADLKAAQLEVRNLKPLVEQEIVNKAQLETAQAQLAQARSNYQGLQAQANYASLRSPVDGMVGTFNFREGALVSPTDAMPLTTVADASSVFAYFSINEKAYSRLIQRLPGSSFQEKIAAVPPLKLILPTGETYPKEGKLEVISRQVDPQTGTVTLRARFPNEEEILLNGGSATIQLPQRYEEIVMVPSLSTFERQGATFVYRISAGDTARAQRIEVVDQTDHYMLVRGGITAGERILARGLAKVRTGEALQPQAIPFDSVATFQKVFR